MALGGVTNATGVTATPGSGGGGGVTQIIAGTNVTISPAGGTGAVTINSTAGGGTSANPTASVGTAAVNGVATTFMTSDSAPAINLAMTPTWTGSHTWTGSAQVVGSGTATQNPPAFTFAGQLTSGFFCTSNVVGVTTSGTQRFSFATAVNTSFVTLRSAAARTHAANIQTAAGGYTVTTSDEFVGFNKTTGAATAVTLLTSPSTGLTLTIFDAKGDAATNNITITPAAGTIDGSATYVINTAYGVWSGFYTGSIWKTIYSR